MHNSGNPFEVNQYQKPWGDRHGFPPFVLAFGWVIIALILFQLTAGIIAVAALAIDPAVEFNFDTLLELESHLGHVFLGNSSGQILVFALGTWLVVLLSTQKDNRLSFLRMTVTPTTGRMMGYTAALILATQPLIWLLSWLNMQVPVSDSYLAFEEVQMKLIENYLRGDHIVLITLFHIGVVPSVCEEIMYRGYIMRMLEKNWGIIAAIVISGLIFGLYHLRVSQILPLAAVGMLLAYVTWKSGSIFPAMVGHFVNNGGSVLLASYYPEVVFDQMDPAKFPPFLLLLISVAATLTLFYFMNRDEEQNRQQTSGG